MSVTRYPRIAFRPIADDDLLRVEVLIDGFPRAHASFGPMISHPEIRAVIRELGEAVDLALDEAEEAGAAS